MVVDLEVVEADLGEVGEVEDSDGADLEVVVEAVRSVADLVDSVSSAEVREEVVSSVVGSTQIVLPQRLAEAEAKAEAVAETGEAAVVTANL